MEVEVLLTYYPGMGKFANKMKKEEYDSFDESGGSSSRETVENFQNEVRVVERCDYMEKEQTVTNDKSIGDTDGNGHVITINEERCIPIARFSSYS